jgi:hypothetical protein
MLVIETFSRLVKYIVIVLEIILLMFIIELFSRIGEKNLRGGGGGGDAT